MPPNVYHIYIFYSGIENNRAGIYLRYVYDFKYLVAVSMAGKKIRKIKQSGGVITKIEVKWFRVLDVNKLTVFKNWLQPSSQGALGFVRDSFMDKTYQFNIIYHGRPHYDFNSENTITVESDNYFEAVGKVKQEIKMLVAKNCKFDWIRYVRRLKVDPCKLSVFKNWNEEK